VKPDPVESHAKPRRREERSAVHKGKAHYPLTIMALIRPRCTSKHKADALSSVIGICEGPQDLAEKHDSYAY